MEHGPEFQKKVMNSWSIVIQGRKMFQLIKKLNKLQSVLQSINKKIFLDVEVQASQTMDKLILCQKRIQQRPGDIALIEEENKLANECIQKNKITDQYLQQRSTIKWIKEGDQNTKFYHRFLKSRRNTNRIFTVKDKKGQYLTEAEKVCKAFIDNYTDLLGKINGDRKHVNSNLIRKFHMVSKEQRS